MLTQIPPYTGLETAAGEGRTLAGTGGFSQGRPVERFGRGITAATSPLAPQYDTAARKNYQAVLIGPES